MKVVVTGGAGFLGQRLIRALCERGRLTHSDGTEQPIEQIVSIDQMQTGRLFVDDRVGYVVGDISNPVFVTNVLEGNTNSVFHLAAVVSGGAEADFDLGMRVNIEGTRAVLEGCRRQRGQHALSKVVFASSSAVFGAEIPAAASPPIITDATTPLPQSSYGTQKLISELLVSDYARKGFVVGRSLRLPTIVVRPGLPNLALSSFASNMIREPLAGHDTECPVEPDASLWILSPQAVVANFIHAHELPVERWGALGGLNLPGRTVTIADMLDALRAVGGETAAARVKFKPDPVAQRVLDTWPVRFDTARADALGFIRDTSLLEVIEAYAAEQARSIP